MAIKRRNSKGGPSICDTIGLEDEVAFGDVGNTGSGEEYPHLVGAIPV
jgi:hypothetical protein